MQRPAPAKKVKQKRNRVITACFDCRERKAGCDRKKPICSRCSDGRPCIYLDPPNHALINGERQKVAALSADVKDKVTRLYSQCQGDSRDDGDASDYEGLEASPLVADSASYDDDADETQVTDLGFRIGKLHLTDRIGGQYRPGMAHELRMLLNGASHQPEWAEEQAAYPVPPEVIETDLTTPTASFLKPSPSYMAPNLSMLSGLSGDDSVENMPPFSIASRILQQYWASVHPVARILHRPSFERRWQTFAHDLQTKTRPAKSLQAIVFSVLLSGITAMPPGTIEGEFGEDQYVWQQKLKAGTEQALVQAQMLQTAKLETLQAFVAYLVVLCRSEISRIHSSLVAAAIRVAECNGLHCDGEERGYNAIETHVRRLIWFSLCFLDIRVTEAQGPRPMIRAEDCTTKFPANVNDDEITATGHPESKDAHWSEMTVPLIRFRCNEFIRSIWVNRRLLMTKGISVTPIINSIESFRLEWSLKYAPTNPDDPLQRYGICMLDMQTLRTYAMVLNIFHIHPKLRMPDRLVSILIENGVKTMDKVIELETSPDYALWRWYAGALQQHHYALLMATEIIMNPRRKESNRIWRGLDYVFEPPPLPPIAKARWVIAQASWKMEVYTGKRQLRVPKNLEENLNEALKLSSIEKPCSDRQSSASTENADDRSPTTKLSTKTAQSLKKRASTKKPSGRASGSRKGDASSESKSPSTLSAGSHPSPATPQKQLMDVDWSILNNYFPPDQFSGDLDVPFDAWSSLLHRASEPMGSEQEVSGMEAGAEYTTPYSNNGHGYGQPSQPGPNAWGDYWPQGNPPSQQSMPPAVQQQYETTYPISQTLEQGPNAGWNTLGSVNPSQQTTHPSSMHWSNTYAQAQLQFNSSYQQPQRLPAQWSGSRMAPGSYNFPIHISAPNQHLTPEQRRQQAHELNFNMGLFQPMPKKS